MMTSTSRAPEALIRSRAQALGFEACRFTDLDALWPAAHRLTDFIAAGHHGEMAWLETTSSRRAHPQAMWERARSAIVLGVNYGPDEDPLAVLERRDRGAISVYAQGDDYHDLIKGRLKQLAGDVSRLADCEVKVFVDTAPLMEKPLAERAGLGWQGKHTNLVSRDFGSWLFLGVILTDRNLAPDPAGTDHCGQCQACLDICPTKAFTAPYKLDARRCISYLTIEFAGPVPVELRPALGNRIYGCDDCLAACPWNKFAQVAREQRLMARDDLRAPQLAELAGLDDAAFRARFSKNPIKRIGRDRFVRNVLYAIGNSGEPGLVEVARSHMTDKSEIIKDAASWAVSRLEGQAN